MWYKLQKFCLHFLLSFMIVTLGLVLIAVMFLHLYQLCCCDSSMIICDCSGAVQMISHSKKMPFRFMHYYDIFILIQKQGMPIPVLRKQRPQLTPNFKLGNPGSAELTSGFYRLNIQLLHVNKQLSYRRETALQGGLVMAKSGRLELRDNIYGQYRSIFNHCDVFGEQRNRNRRKNAK